jgi:hypothetical protein
MKSIEQLKEQLEALESLSMSQLSLDMPKPAPSLLRGVMELLEAQEKEIAELKDTVAYHAGVLKGIQNQEMRRHGWPISR